VQEWYTKVLSPIADKHGMTFDTFGERVANASGNSHYLLKVDNATLHGVEPAPFSPSGRTDLPFQLLSGTIKATYNAHRHLGDADEIIVSPGMMTGNTGERTDIQCSFMLSFRLTDEAVRFRYKALLGLIETYLSV
jgi:Gly-Xaa carboxypeptidase